MGCVECDTIGQVNCSEHCGRPRHCEGCACSDAFDCAFAICACADCGCLQKVEAMAHVAGRIHDDESLMAGAMQLSAMAETQMRRLECSA